MRVALIRELGELTKAFPEVKKALRKHQKNEESDNLKEMIDGVLNSN